MGMRRRIFIWVLVFSLVAMPVKAEPIRWVDFQIPYESLKYAMEVDIATFDQEKHISWIDVLAIAACRTGGTCNLKSAK
jgi:hypothetical protein